MKLDATYKICLSGLLLALVIIFTRFLSIQNIPFIPFVRISIGPSLIIFSSIFLGPIYGAIIGGVSDILGILLVPNSLGFSINPWFTLVYTILGIVPYFVYKLFKKIKNDKLLFILFSAILFCLWVFVLVFTLTNNVVSSHELVLYEKLLIIIGSFVLLLLVDLFILLLKKKQKDASSFMKASFTSLIIEISILLLLNSFMKSIFFEIDFYIIFFFQSIVLFINVPLDAFVVTYLLRLTNKIFVKENKAK